MEEETSCCMVETYGKTVPCDAGMKNAVQSAADRTAHLEGLENYEACIVLTDDAYLHELNRQYRGVDAPTDVISFPENQLDRPLAEAIARGYVPDTDLTGRRISLGDIYISVERAARQAEEYGNTLEQELCFLAVHGMLHLMGYDHIEEQDERVMRAKQREALGRQ